MKVYVLQEGCMYEGGTAKGVALSKERALSLLAERVAEANAEIERMRQWEQQEKAQYVVYHREMSDEEADEVFDTFKPYVQINEFEWNNGMDYVMIREFEAE